MAGAAPVRHTRRVPARPAPFRPARPARLSPPIPRPPPAPSRLSSPLAGIALMVLATVVFAAQDTITKALAQSLPIGQIVFVRFCAFLAFALAFAARGPGVGAALRSAVPARQALRCALMCSEIALFAWALRHLGIAEIHALFACFPLVVAALSAPLLGERVGPLRWAAVALGLLGTLLILRPGSDVFDPWALAPLACAVLYALYNLLTRQVSKRDGFATSLLYFGLVGTLASAGFAWAQWQSVDGREALLLGALCATSVLGHMMLIRALALTEAVVLQPFHYLVLVWAIAIGHVVYGETLGASALAGAALVVGSGVFVGWREYLASRRAAAVGADPSGDVPVQPRHSTSASATPSISRP